MLNQHCDLQSVTPALTQSLGSLLPRMVVELVPELDSTNTELMRRAHAGRLDPILLVAERQTAGRGRMGRDWHSDGAGSAGSLTFSLGLPLEPLTWSGLSLAVGLAIAQALHPQIQLKWPNDLWFRQRKLGGILIETASIGTLRYAVVGVGINIQLPTAPGLRTPAAALVELLPQASAAAVLERIAAPLVQSVIGFAEHTFAPLRQAFHACDALYGLEVQTSDGTLGLARGVDASGALLLHTSAGLKKISSAEVSVQTRAQTPAVLPPSAPPSTLPPSSN